MSPVIRASGRVIITVLAGACVSLPANAATGVPPVLPPSLLADTPVGTWNVDITTYDCQTRAANPPFQSILSFGVGGTEVETTDNPSLALGQRSPAFGSWGYTGFRQIAMVTEAFILFPSDAGPIKKGMQVIRHAIKLVDADTFTDSAVLTFYDTSGAATLTECASASGKRL